ncbi:MAG: hypothetical protein PUB42_06995, partial [Firmicutes bacterium]|nr:hypothetical protein [Bacillota bacterium]
MYKYFYRRRGVSRVSIKKNIQYYVEGMFFNWSILKKQRKEMLKMSKLKRFISTLMAICVCSLCINVVPALA